MGIICTSLVAMSLAYIFVSILRSEIGLKFWGVVGSFPGFGKVIIKALSISFVREEEEAASLHICER